MLGSTSKEFLLEAPADIHPDGVSGAGLSLFRGSATVAPGVFACGRLTNLFGAARRLEGDDSGAFAAGGRRRCRGGGLLGQSISHGSHQGPGRQNRLQPFCYKFFHGENILGIVSFRKTDEFHTKNQKRFNGPSAGLFLSDPRKIWRSFRTEGYAAR